jgi:hypothetical protein
VWHEISRLLSTYSSAVVTVVAPDGYPISFRCTPDIDHAGEVLRIDPPPAVLLRAGRAGLLCHRHDERLWRLHSFHVAGSLERRDASWVLRPDRLTVGLGHGGLVHQLRVIRSAQRTAAAYLARRGWERPPIDWRRLKALKREVFV